MKKFRYKKSCKSELQCRLDKTLILRLFFLFFLFFALIPCVYGNLYLETSKDKHNEGLKLLQNKRYPAKIAKPNLAHFMYQLDPNNDNYFFFAS